MAGEVMGRKPTDLTGRVYGYLTVEKFAARTAARHSVWTCRCVCGATKDVLSTNLRQGSVRSCGCKTAEMVIARLVARGAKKTAEHRREYVRWSSMIFRCHGSDEANPNYGGRGITVCDRWRFGEEGKTGFECFVVDMGEPPFAGASVDRIDNNGNYEPDNCRWATRTQQNRNRRDTIICEVNGERLSLADLIEARGLNRSTAIGRLRKGLSPEMIIAPARPIGRPRKSEVQT